MSLALNPSQIPLEKEKKCLIFVAIVAAICWLIIVCTIIGAIYGALIALFVWLAHGLMIARIRSESVFVTENQMPELYATYRGVVEQLGVAPAPPLYIMQSHGMLNAFATRWCGRHFVVLYSDMLEACGEDTAQIRFLLGHELGHVRSNHIAKKLYLLPGTLFPLIGSAYSRACEGSCDRFGAYAAGDLHAASQALMVLAGGKIAWQRMDPAAFGQQYEKNRGFFVSWHELTSGYPTLSQRVQNILTMEQFAQPVRAPRNGWAYVFALFTVGGQQGTSGNMLVTIAVIAMLAGIAMPAIVAAKNTAMATQSMQHEQALAAACREYAATHDGYYPPSLGDLYPSYVADKKIFASPFAPAQEIGYDYHSGLSVRSSPQYLLIEDHYSPTATKRVVTYANGSARVLSTAAQPVAPQ